MKHKFKIGDEVIIINADYYGERFLRKIGTIMKISENLESKTLYAVEIKNMTLNFYEKEIILATKAVKVLYGT